MSGSARKRSSKWDMSDGPEFAPDSKQLHSYLEGNDKSKYGTGFSSKESFSRGRGSNKDDIMNKDYRDWDETMEWDADESYSKKFSPGFEELKYNRRSQSPKNGRSMSVRSSRSRSPPHGFRRDSGFNDVSRTTAGGSLQPCREFAAGKCRRGSHCHFLHHDNQNYEDSWESKHREDGAPKYYAPHDSRDHSHRSGRSNEACVNFAKGRCRNGSSCKFVHNNSDGYSKGSVDESNRERENDRRRRDNSFDQGGGHGPNRSGPPPCKFFANGNCRNAKSCRFSHDRQAYGSSPNRRSREDKWGSNPGGDHQTLDRRELIDSVSSTGRLRDDRWGSDGNMVDMDNPKRNDTVAVSDTSKLVEDKCGNIDASDPGFTSWPRKDGWGHALYKNREHSEPTFSSGKETGHWMAENAGANKHVPQPTGTGNWSGDEMSPDWNYRVRSSSHIQEEHGQNKHGITQGGTYLATEHEGTQVIPGQALNQNAQNINPLHSSSGHGVGQSQVDVPILPSREVVESMHNQQVTAGLPEQGFNQNSQNPNLNPFHSSSSHAVGQSQVAVPGPPSRGVDKSMGNQQVSTDVPTGQGFNQNPQNINPFYSSVGLAVGQSQVAVPILHSKGVIESIHKQQVSNDVLPGQVFNHNAQNINPLHSLSGHAVGQSQVAVPILPSRGIIESMHNQEVSAEKKYTVEPNIKDEGLSQVSSRNPPTKNMVSNEQLTQLSNLSASLAHILGTGQQLPQLYAALNSNDAKDTSSLAKTEVPAIPVSNTFIKPDPVLGYRKQYDPMCDSIETKKVVASGATPAFSPSKKNAKDKAEIPSLASNSGRRNLEVNKEKNEVVVEDRQNSPGDHKNTKENGPLENMDQKGGPDDDKKSKDTKGVRTFKFALVDLVKELLKPAWKEGQINKEDYKAIVKKVVDKVTGTMQGTNIPQTQEKIDHYLSFSKPKLSKLVQAYVERVQKA
ncbi:PREDICTED: zinc finger CCCH domain-containing protein 38-like isoform X2 [Lupinus angustifolius]|uniref:zinc finger CCCH domain-containing protein 38-like isoform X2 n=1 Tax=Lupinus angustifolius TaxID=3871 RepID=UPI00092ECFEC|nr:PREDICTED: zinc finger CCCH domain-containing protein 38-like isoform X2 [Lupinus angustifolius]